MIERLTRDDLDDDEREKTGEVINLKDKSQVRRKSLVADVGAGANNASTHRPGKRHEV